MANKTPIRPGQPAPISAQYAVVGPRGGQTGVEVTGVRGKTMPPTPGKGMGYVPVDPTKNGAGRR